VSRGAQFSSYPYRGSADAVLTEEEELPFAAMDMSDGASLVQSVPILLAPLEIRNRRCEDGLQAAECRPVWQGDKLKSVSATHECSLKPTVAQWLLQ